ncbi:MAG: type I toxin-antitoxin system Fst family toxin [Staphylococcus rostri]|nr:type I toxin-antitoxin system Fst family toxin [Staphylococcus rostri]MDO5376497.1 type I toxin-antitoxin system Fst family toxin [Staphylococcus rostri]
MSVLYSTLVAPIIIGNVLTTYTHWLDNRKR